jgi:hypothetical protein
MDDFTNIAIVLLALALAAGVRQRLGISILKALLRRAEDRR